MVASVRVGVRVSVALEAGLRSGSLRGCITVLGFAGHKQQ